MSSLSPASVASTTTEPPSSSQLSYLRDHDDPMRWEAPRMFNRCAELRRLERFIHDLEQRVGRRLDYEMSAGLDEAAFHGEVFFEGASIRFSNFGRMVAIFQAMRLSPGARRLVASVAFDHGYVLIEEGVLEEPYEGNTGLSHNETWGSRFFGSY
jgi:hypothetical protein